MQLQVLPTQTPSKRDEGAAPQPTFEALTGLRAVAAAWVICYHYRTEIFRPLGANHIVPVLGYGYLGVDLFFILSGFVIWHVHGKEMARPTPRVFLRFICLRAARLYPVYLVTLAIFAGMVWLVPAFGVKIVRPSAYPIPHLVYSILLIQTWGLTSNLTWNFPAWSVSAEWFCYILFPLAAIVGGRLSPRAMVVGIVILLAAVTVIYLTAFNLTFNQVIGWRALLRASIEFILGCLLREFQARVRTEAWPWTAIVAGVAALWLVSFYTPLPVSVVAIPLFATLVLAGSVRGNMVSRIGSWRPLVAVGAASYSLYLMQAPIEKGAWDLRQFLIPAKPIESAAVVLILLGLLGLGTTLIHLLVENPSRRWLRVHIDRHFPTGPGARHSQR